MATESGLDGIWERFPEGSYEYVQEFLENYLHDPLFCPLAEHFKLESGDTSPEWQLALDNVKEALIKLIEEWLFSNYYTKCPLCEQSIQIHDGGSEKLKDGDEVINCPYCERSFYIVKDGISIKDHTTDETGRFEVDSKYYEYIEGEEQNDEPEPSKNPISGTSEEICGNCDHVVDVLRVMAIQQCPVCFNPLLPCNFCCEFNNGSPCGNCPLEKLRDDLGMKIKEYKPDEE